MVDRVTTRTMDLWGAAQRVGVLDPVVVVAVAGHDRRPRQQRPQVRGAGLLAHLGTHAHQVGVEGAVGAQQRLGRHGAGDVGHEVQVTQVGHSHDQHAEHPVGAVDQCQAFLGREHEGMEAGVGQRPVCRHASVGRVDVAFPEQGQGGRRQGGEVTAGADRSVFEHDRRDVMVEQVADGLCDLGSRPGEPHCEAACAQDHHRPNDLALEFWTHAGSMRTHQCQLQFGTSFGRDHRVGQCAEASRDAVDRLVSFGQAGHDLGAASECDHGVVGQFDSSPVPGHVDDGGRIHPVVVEGDRC